MATILKEQHKTQLRNWIDSSKRYKFILLFKASRDGCTAQTFHKLCDNKGPTVTVLFNTDKSIFGGYTSASWHCNGSYSDDRTAFLFKMEYNGKTHPQKFPHSGNDSSAIYGASTYGPTFGAGPDLRIFEGSINKTNDYYPLNGTISLGNSYNMKSETSDTIMNGHLNVRDIHVYSVEGRKSIQDRPPPPPPPSVEEVLQLKKGWVRDIDWSSQFMKELKEAVETYKPLRGLDLPQANILMVGQVGAGKSSFFNTINSIYRTYVSGQANAGSAGHSLTTKYRMYQVRAGYGGKPLNFRLCDTRGLEEDQGLDDQEIGYLLDGHVHEGYQFNPSLPLSPDAREFVKSPTVKDKVHCVAFVIDSSTVDVMPEKVLERMKNMQSRMNQRGIPQVVLLTKIDRICELVADGVSDVFMSPTVKECVDRVSMVMGLPRSHILPIKNYECEFDLDQDVNILSLLSMRRILHFCDDYLYNQLDLMEASNETNGITE